MRTDKPVNHNQAGQCLWLGIGTIGVGTFGIGLAVFLSIKSSPSMSAVDWLPHFLTHWADRHGRLCNFPAYALLALPFLLCARHGWQRAWVVAGLAVLIAALEIVQLWIPSRVADKWDVFWGCSGLLASWSAIELIPRILFKTSAPKHRKS